MCILHKLCTINLPVYFTWTMYYKSACIFYLNYVDITGVVYWRRLNLDPLCWPIIIYSWMGLPPPPSEGGRGILKLLWNTRKNMKQLNIQKTFVLKKKKVPSPSPLAQWKLVSFRSCIHYPGFCWPNTFQRDESRY